MPSTSAPAAAARPRQFQFTLATLLVAMAWVGFLCLALRQPTPFWLGAMFLLTLLVMLGSILVAVYRTGRARAFAVGFLVFGAGYLVCMALVAGGPQDLLRRGWTPVQGASVWLFDRLHPPRTVPADTAGMGPGMGMPGMMGSPDGGYGGGYGEGSAGAMGGGLYGAMPGSSGMGGEGGYTGTVTIPSSFDQRHFSAICNLAMSCLLGVVGGIVAQWLYATRRD